MSNSIGGNFPEWARSCAKEHEKIVWTSRSEACPVCSVLADLRKVSAELAKAQEQIAVDNDLLVKHSML